MTFETFDQSDEETWPDQHFDNFWQFWQFSTILTFLTNFDNSDHFYNFDNLKKITIFYNFLQKNQTWWRPRSKVEVSPLPLSTFCKPPLPTSGQRGISWPKSTPGFPAEILHLSVKTYLLWLFYGKLQISEKLGCSFLGHLVSNLFKILYFSIYR